MYTYMMLYKGTEIVYVCPAGCMKTNSFIFRFGRANNTKEFAKRLGMNVNNLCFELLFSRLVYTIAIALHYIVYLMTNGQHDSSLMICYVTHICPCPS